MGKNGIPEVFRDLFDKVSKVRGKFEPSHIRGQLEKIQKLYTSDRKDQFELHFGYHYEELRSKMGDEMSSDDEILLGVAIVGVAAIAALLSRRKQVKEEPDNGHQPKTKRHADKVLVLVLPIHVARRLGDIQISAEAIKSIYLATQWIWDGSSEEFEHTIKPRSISEGRGNEVYDCAYYALHLSDMPPIPDNPGSREVYFGRLASYAKSIDYQPCYPLSAVHELPFRRI